MISRPNPKVKGSKKREARYGIGIAVAVVVLMVAAIAWLVFATDEGRESEEAGRGAKKDIIAETAPATTAIVNPEARIAETSKPLRKWECPVEHTNELTAAELRKWNIVHRPRLEPFTRERPRADYEIFDYRSENMIASLLAAKPGQGFIGTPNYKGIAEDFLESCRHPIVVTDDDDEYSAALKRDMIAVKMEIKGRLDNGESLADILQETRKEYQRLAQCRRFVQEELRKMEKENPSPEDIDDFVTAANKLLEEKGIAPISVGPITKRRLMKLRGEE